MNADENSAIKGEQVVLSAGFGDIGSSVSAINLTANGDITAYAGNGASLYLKSNKDLNINEIRSFNTYDSTTGTTTSDSVLANVVLTTSGNIVNAAYDEKANIAADNIMLTAGNDIGSVIKYFNVDTKSDNLQNGLQYSAENAYINGIGSSLNVISAVVNGDANISSLADLSVVVKDVSAGGMLNIKSGKDTALVGNIAANGVNIVSAAQTNLSDIVINSPLENTSDKLVVSNSTLKNIKTNSNTADFLNSDIKDNADITTIELTNITNTNIGGDFTNNSANTNISEIEVVGNADITSSETIIGKVNIGGNFTNNSANTNISEIEVVGNTDITSTEKTTISKAKVGGNFTNNSKDTQITDKLTVSGDTNISAENTISIANAELKNLTTTSSIADIADMTITNDVNLSASETIIGKANIGGNFTNNSANTNISEIEVVGNTDITSTEKTTISKAKVGGNFTNNSKDTQITDKLTVSGDTNISAENTISIANAELNKSFNIKAKDLSVKDLNLSGNINAQVDKLDVTSTNDLNIGYICGNTVDYVDDVRISSSKSILNGRTDDGVNLNVRLLDLNANNSIGSEEKPLKLLLAEGNILKLKSGDLTSVLTSGAATNYANLEAGSFTINTDSDINIESINVENFVIKTSSNNLKIDNLNVSKTAIFDVGNKRIIVN
ncbi:MAG: beta strand repeat-containing protein, partial [Candidatus Gastranaerophilaceae bacterium]